MQKFIIGTDNFGVGEITYNIDKTNSIINDLTIIGDKQIFEQLSDNEEGSWGWTLYPPKFYLRAIPYQLIGGKLKIIINEEILDKSEAALYLMEHNDIQGTVTIDESEIFSFEGNADVFGEKMKLELEVNLIFDLQKD